VAKADILQGAVWRARTETVSESKFLSTVFCRLSSKELDRSQCHKANASIRADPFQIDVMWRQAEGNRIVVTGKLLN